MNKKNEQSTGARKVTTPAIFAGLLTMVSVASWAGPEDTMSAIEPPVSRVSLADDAWSDSDIRGRRPATGLSSLLARCDSCEVHLGVGGTYHSFKGTRGVVLPLSVTWHENRYEFGIYRFASTQSSDDNDEHVERLVARPYWGASLSRRFALLERGPFSAFFGFGVSYKTEQDILSITHWNFASQLGVRFQSPHLPAVLEFSARHWSNGGVRTPNRGQDFAVLTVRFDR
jgi:hypothetical protein